MVYFSVLLSVKHVNLILWLKVYVAFNDLHNLKILICERKMIFKIGSLRYVKYIEQKPTQNQPPPILRGHAQSQTLKRGYQKKMRAWGDLNSSFQRYLPRGAYCVSCQKRLYKIKYGFENSISNIYLGLFQPPNNQLMFSFVTFWFC